MRPSLRALLLVTDLGFLAYWALTLGHVLPRAWLFRGYEDPTVAAWNLSFLPLDLVVSATGLGAVGLLRRCPAAARSLLTMSLVATSISGLQAIAFWTLRRDFDLGWWAPNLFLLAWPLPFLARLAWTAHAPERGPAHEPAT
ncbi:MAG: DUF5360 family protein [Myxococcales bacterium]|nr:DUF5360 family protein [Myxococcales bacterium]